MIHAEKITDQTYKFAAGKTIAECEMTLTSPQEALNSPLGKKLFGFPWTEALKINLDSVELTKKDWVDWDVLLEPLQGLLEEHFSQVTALEKSPRPLSENRDTAEAEQIKEFIENAINPSLAAHGGFIELKSFENKTAYLTMGGGCQGCASSQATMVEGVELALKERFSFVERIMDVTDHASGDNPYYSN
jgi:NFU1 iron-sulfur cluster scaffold homolog, mitochondrial